jgi:hypothetical protein
LDCGGKRSATPLLTSSAERVLSWRLGGKKISVKLRFPAFHSKILKI